MNYENTKALWNMLSQKILVEGEPSKEEVQSPWYIKLLLSISGWFGALFLLIFASGFLALTLGRDIDKFPLLLIFIGGALIFLAYHIFQEKQSDFLEHFILALSIAGQAMVIFSLFFMFDSNIFNSQIDTRLILFTAFFQAFLMWIIPNYIHRMLASFFMALAFSYFFYRVGEIFMPSMILTFVVAWLWMNEFNFTERKKIEAIAYGQTVALFSLKYFLMSSSYYFYELFEYKDTPIVDFWLLEFTSILTLGYVLWMIIKETQHQYDKKTLLLLAGAIVFLSFLSFEVGGLVLGVILLFIGFAHSHRLLMGLGIFSLLIFLSHYYYYLGETLMDKAGVLALMGVLLLLSRFIMKNILIGKEVSDV